MTILAAIDGEQTPDHGLVLGADLADRFDDDLLALHVMPMNRFERIRAAYDRESSTGSMPLALEEGFAYRAGDQAAEPNPYTIDVAQNNAANAAREVIKASLTDAAGVGVQGRVGDPAEEIVAEADRQDARFVIVGGRKRTPVGKAVFGSVTQSVLLNADQPVLTVPEEGADPADGPVLAAVDRTDRAARVVEEAAALADATGRPLHVVHVLTRRDFAEREGDRDRSAVEDDDVRAAAADIAAEAAEGIATASTPVGLVGQPSEALIDYADDEAAGFLVLSGRRRSPVGKVLFGSVVQSVLLSAGRPVLTVMGPEDSS